MTTEEGLSLAESMKTIEESLSFSIEDFAKRVRSAQQNPDPLAEKDLSKLPELLEADETLYKQLFIALSKKFIPSLLPLRKDTNF